MTQYPSTSPLIFLPILMVPPCSGIQLNPEKCVSLYPFHAQKLLEKETTIAPWLSVMAMTFSPSGITAPHYNLIVLSHPFVPLLLLRMTVKSAGYYPPRMSD